MSDQHYIVFDDFGSTAHKFIDQKEYIRQHVKGLTFSSSAWDELADMLRKQGQKNPTPEGAKFLGIPVYVVENQRYKCIGWYNENMCQLYVKGAEIRKAVLQQTIDKVTRKN